MTTYDASQPSSLSPVVADHPLSPRGRLSRLAFLAWYFVISMAVGVVAVGGLALMGGFSHTGGDSSSMGMGSLLIIAIGYIVFFYYAFVLTIRRLHDINQSGWLSLLMLVPLVNLFFMLYVMCAPGTQGVNNFGPQRPTQGWEKALGIIYIVLSVLGIVAMIAMLTMTGSMLGDMSQFSQMSQQY